MYLLKKPEFMSEDNWNKIPKLNIDAKSALSLLSDALERKTPMNRNTIVRLVNNHRYKNKNKYYKKLYLSKLRDVEITVDVYEHKSPLTTFMGLYGDDILNTEPELSMRMCAPRPELKSDYSIPPTYIPSYDSAWLVARGQMMLPPEEMHIVDHSECLDDETIRIHPYTPDRQTPHDTADIFNFIKTNTFKISGGNK